MVIDPPDEDKDTKEKRIDQTISTGAMASFAIMPTQKHFQTKRRSHKKKG